MAQAIYIEERDSARYYVQRCPHTEGFYVIPCDWITAREVPKHLMKYPHIFIPRDMLYPREKGQWRSDKAVDVAHELLAHL